MELPWYESATWGMVGGVFLYLCMHRADRIQEFFSSPQRNWRILVFDLVVFLIGAGLFTAFLIEPSIRKEAFLSGATWEGAAAGLLTRKS
jgi:hypothetical protein